MKYLLSPHPREVRIWSDLVTADHKVQSENCESRKNHRYAIMVQDLATQWVQSYPWQNKNFAGNTKKLAKVLGARCKVKVVDTHDSALAKLVKISLGIIARLHHTDRRLMILLIEQCAE